MLKKFATDITRGLRSMVRGLDADWDFEERRRSVRFPCRHKVEMTRTKAASGVSSLTKNLNKSAGTVSAPKTTKEITYVIDYSMGGVRISTVNQLRVGEELQLRFPHPLKNVKVSNVNCEVVWTRKNPKTLERVSGLKFKETKERMAASWVAYLFRERGSSSGDLREDRKFFRAACNLEVLARGEEERAVGRCRNLSTHGALVELNRPPEPEERWALDLSGLSTLPPMHVHCEVLGCEINDEGLYVQRVQFVNIDEETAKTLRKYLLHLCKDFWTD